MENHPLYSRINIIHKPSSSEPFLIMDKPSGLPSAPLKEGDPSALTWALENFYDLRLIQGKKNCEAGLVHRIDNDTRGLVLVAASQDFYDRITEEQKGDRFIKTYGATCRYTGKTMDLPDDDSFPPLDEKLEKMLDGLKNNTNNRSFQFFLSSKFRFYGNCRKLVRPVTDLSGPAAIKKASPKEYKTEINLKKNEDGTFQAQCCISQGFKHQVRCHLSWLGFPVVQDPFYDPLYDPDSHENIFDFTACGLQFLGWNFTL